MNASRIFNLILAGFVIGCGRFNVARTATAQEQLAVIADDRIDESSGMALSQRQDDAVWIHNDSGDKPRLFLVGLDGDTKTVLDVKQADAVDWEDMCSFTAAGQPWLLIGDVGDNDAERTAKKDQCQLYLLKEPKLSQANVRFSRPWDIRVRFEYEDGPRNCEGVAVDVERQEILLLTKESPLSCGLYRLDLDLDDRQQSETAERIADVPAPFATAIDVSPDGRRLAIVTMWGGWICTRNAEESWADALRSDLRPIKLPPRRQGETACFSRDGRFLYLNSEKIRQPLWRILVEVPPDD